MAKATLGTLIDKAAKLNEEISAVNKTLKTLSDEKRELQQEIIDALKQQGVTSSGGRTHTTSYTEDEVYVIEDTDAFYKWIYRNKAAFVLQRRLSQAPLKEMAEMRKGRAIPGLVINKVDKLTFRKKAK